MGKNQENPSEQYMELRIMMMDMHNFCSSLAKFSRATSILV